MTDVVEAVIIIKIWHIKLNGKVLDNKCQLFSSMLHSSNTLCLLFAADLLHKSEMTSLNVFQMGTVERAKWPL